MPRMLQAIRNSHEKSFLIMFEASAKLEVPQLTQFIHRTAARGLIQAQSAAFTRLFELACAVEAASWLLRTVRRCLPSALSAAIQNGQVQAMLNTVQLMQQVFAAKGPWRPRPIRFCGPVLSAVASGRGAALLQFIATPDFHKLHYDLHAVYGKPYHVWKQPARCFSFGFSKRLLNTAARAGDPYTLAGIFEMMLQRHYRFTAINPRVAREARDMEAVYSQNISHWLTHIARAASPPQLAIALAWAAHHMQGAHEASHPPPGSFDFQAWCFSEPIQAWANTLLSGSEQELQQVVRPLLKVLDINAIIALLTASATRASPCDSTLHLCFRVVQGCLSLPEVSSQAETCCSDAQCVNKHKCITGQWSTSLLHCLQLGISRAAPALIEGVLRLRPPVPAGLLGASLQRQITWTADPSQYAMTREMGQFIQSQLGLVQRFSESPLCASMAVNSQDPALLLHASRIRSGYRSMLQAQSSEPAHFRAAGDKIRRALYEVSVAWLKLGCQQAGAGATRSGLHADDRAIWSDIMWGNRRLVLLKRLQRRQASYAF